MSRWRLSALAVTHVAAGFLSLWGLLGPTFASSGGAALTRAASAPTSNAENTHSLGSKNSFALFQTDVLDRCDGCESCYGY